jgi:Secretion system C-terminal sorting domain
VKLTKDIVKITPNPNNGIFKINLNEVSQGTIAVTDLYGFTVYKSEFKNQNEFEMNLQDNPKGIYIVKVVSGDQTYTSKIIKN